MIFGTTAIIRWKHDSIDPREKQSFSLELKVNGTNKLLNRYAADSADKMLQRIRLLMVNSNGNNNQNSLQNGVNGVKVETTHLQAKQTARDLHRSRLEMSQQAPNDEDYPRIVSDKDPSAILSKTSPLYQIFPISEMPHRRIQITETESIKLVLNPPTITGQPGKEIKLVMKPKVGVCIIPKMTVQFGTADDFSFKWFKMKMSPKILNKKQQMNGQKNVKNQIASKHKWTRQAATTSVNLNGALPVKVENGTLDSPVSKKAKMDLAKSNSNESNGLSNGTLPATEKDSKEHEPQHLASGKMYTPTEADIGFQISVHAQLKNPIGDYEGTAHIAFTNDVVTPHSILNTKRDVPFKARHKQTSHKYTDAENFRVMTYNILSDCYAQSEFTTHKLAPYMDTKYLEMNDHRLPLLIEEISGYQSDIIFLQEVEKKVFESELTQQLATLSYHGVFSPKQKSKEGVAMFFDSTRYKILRTINKHPKDILMAGNPRSVIGNLLGYNVGGPDKGVSCPEKIVSWYETSIRRMKDPAKGVGFLNACIGPGTVMQVSTLQDKKKSAETGVYHFIIAANTHLYFHSHASNVRLMQIKIMHDMIMAAEAHLIKTYGSDKIKILKITAGDLNSLPKSGIIDYLTGNTIPKNSMDWYSGGRDQYIGFDLIPEFKLKSAIDFDKVPYTTLVNNFCGVLDYILFDDKLVEQTKYIDNPSHEEVTKDIGLPSEVFPSDHIAQVVEFRWRE